MSKRKSLRNSIDELRGLGPSKVPSSLRHTEEVVDSAYCPLLRAKCSTVDCKNCSLPYEYFEFALIWVCSNCTADYSIQPFWGDGNCEICGHRSPVLMLATLPDD